MMESEMEMVEMVEILKNQFPSKTNSRNVSVSHWLCVLGYEAGTKGKERERERDRRCVERIPFDEGGGGSIVPGQDGSGTHRVY